MDVRDLSFVVTCRACHIYDGRIASHKKTRAMRLDRKLPAVEEFAEGVAREIRAIRSGGSRLRRNCSRKSSNSVRMWPFEEELLGKVEQFGSDVAV